MAQLQSLADAPNTLREYETIYILRPETVNEKVAEVNAKIREVIETTGGKVVSVDNWGKRKLAYEIRKQMKGIYLYWQYIAQTDTVAEVERNIRMIDSVIRYMTINTARNVNPNETEIIATDEMYEKAATTAADEEELMLGRGPQFDGDRFDLDDDDQSTDTFVDDADYIGDEISGESESTDSDDEKE